MWTAASRSGSVSASPEWTDVQLVTQAMHRLDQMEIEFFRTAWREWYGTEPEDKALEPGFQRYLFQQVAPTYVRHFAREILSDVIEDGAPAPDRPDLSALDQIGDGGAAIATGARRSSSFVAWLSSSEIYAIPFPADLVIRARLPIFLSEELGSPAMFTHRPNRRHLVKGALVLGATAVLPQGLRAALIPTPRQTPGPFYPRDLPLDSDNDLVSVAGRDKQAEGQVLHIFGRVFDQGGRALSGLRVEIWQCDALGRYHHPRDSGGLDPNFQGFGRMAVDPEAGYRFRTIKPVPYPGRAPHVHFAVAGRGIERLTTQMYVAGDPLNAKDFLFRRLNADAKARVSVRPYPGARSGAGRARRPLRHRTRRQASARLTGSFPLRYSCPWSSGRTLCA